MSNFTVNTTANDVVWRNLGRNQCRSFSNPVTINEAVDAIGANYNVKKETLVRVPDFVIDSIYNGNNENITLTKDNIITSHMATIREDTNKTLGVVGSRYGVVQNTKAFEFIDIMTSGELNGKQQPIIETAGILGDGERMYVTAKMPSKLYIDGDDSDGIDDYILFTNSHDGSGAVTILFTPLRVICQNTLNAAIRNASNKLVFKHTANVNERLEWTKRENMERAVAVLRMHEKFKTEFIDQLTNLKKQTITENEINYFTAQVMATPAQAKLLQLNNWKMDNVEEVSTRTKNNIIALRDSIESGVGQDKFRGTKLWLYNGLTTFLNNTKQFKSAEDKFNSLVFGGDGNKKVQKAFDILAA